MPSIRRRHAGLTDGGGLVTVWELCAWRLRPSMACDEACASVDVGKGRMCVMKPLNVAVKMALLAFCALGAVALYGIAPNYNNGVRSVFRDGVQYIPVNRLNDPTFDQETEARDIADYLHRTEVYAKLPKALKEKIDRNQKNYYVVNRDHLYDKDPYKLFFLYDDRNICINYGTTLGYEAIKIDMQKHPQSLEGYVMASYEPSKAIDKKTGKPYFWVPERILNQISAEERAYFETFLEVVNENYHFLTAYPLLTLEPKRFADGEYWAKFVPAQYLVTDGSVPKPRGYQPGLKDELQTRLGAPVYDLSQMKVTYDYSDCTEYNYRGKLRGVKGAYVGFFRYDPKWTIDEVQIRVFRTQTGVRRVSLEQLKKRLAEEYALRKDTFSHEADFIYRKLNGMIAQKIEEQLKRLPSRGLTSEVHNMPEYTRLRHRPAYFEAGEAKIKAE